MHNVFISRVHNAIFSPQLVQSLCNSNSHTWLATIPTLSCFPNNLLCLKMVDHNKQKCI